MSKFKLSDEAQVTLQEADRIINMYFSKIPKVKEFLSLVARTAVKNGFLRSDPTNFRRIRWFPKLDRGDFKTIGETERAAKNFPAQGTNANIIKQALINLQDIIDSNNYPVKILLSIHDELLTECDGDFAEIWRPILESTMIKAGESIIKSVPVKVEGVISDYWTK